MAAGEGGGGEGEEEEADGGAEAAVAAIVGEGAGVLEDRARVVGAGAHGQPSGRSRKRPPWPRAAMACWT